jgi:hypothetical protein
MISPLRTLFALLLSLFPAGPCPDAGIGMVLVRADGPAAPAPPAATPQEYRKAVALVRQLGDRSFRIREQASRELLKMRLAARQAVEEGTKDKDPEVRRHCRQLLPELLRADLFERIDGLVADREGKNRHDLPGWPLFRELVGSDDDARRLFADVSRREPDLLAALEKNPAQAADVCDKRCQQLAKTLHSPAIPVPLPADLAPLFLVAADRRVKVSTDVANYLCSALERPGPREAMTVQPPGSPFRKLVLAWMERQTDGFPMGRVLQAATNLRLPEAAGMAIKVARHKQASTGARGEALVLLGKGKDGNDHLALFESLLEDRGVVAGFGIGGPGGGWRGTTELRDVALAMLVHLTDQKHADYGFTYTRSGRSFLFNAPVLGFSSNEDREAALKKWKTWKAAQNQKKKKQPPARKG